MAAYVQGYGIIASPLHFLTKSKTAFPKPWVIGPAYDIAFKRLKAAMLDGTRFLHHQNINGRLFIEVDASDQGWGACLYQMKEKWEGLASEEGRLRVGDTGPRKVIQ